MVEDARLAEKEIAAHLVEEIDGKNLLRYQFGDSFIAATVPFQSTSLGDLFVQTVEISPVPVISCSIRVGLDVTVTGKGSFIWKIFKDKELVKEISFTIDGHYADEIEFPIEHGSFDLKISLEGNNDKVIVGGTIELLAKHDKKVITAEDLNTPVFYVERIKLFPDSAVIFDNLGTLFKNNSTKTETYSFNKAIAFRKLEFLKGTAEVILYFLKKKTDEMRIESATKK